MSFYEFGVNINIYIMNLND